MIIFNKEKCEGTFLEQSVGIVGENLINEVVFMVNGFVGEKTNASIHLRFADGSVNSVAPQEVLTVDNGTKILWKIVKNDIFCHGWIEVQLELRDDEKLLQTEIIRLFAGESLPIEDKEYSNPNSENIALRDEIKMLWDKTYEQNEQIAENLKLINESDLSLKADKATTLSGYGITDAYNKSYIEKALNYKLDKMPFDTTLTQNSPNYITSGTMYSVINEVNKTINKNKTDADKSIATKYDSSNFESGVGTLSPTQAAYEGNEGSFIYAKNGDIVTLSVSLNTLVADKNYLQMAGLPFTVRAESKLAGMAVYSTTNKLRNIRLDGTWIYITAPSDKFTADEKIKFNITYIIRK